MDTPGQVDFAYEVSRSLAACEGALLIVDAAQGVEAQTVANVHLAMKQKLPIIPVINKIDLPTADIPNVKHQLEDILAIPGEEAILCSAKSGIGIDEILEAVIHRIPAPDDNRKEPLQALVFDSMFDSFRGVVVHVRVFAGELVPGMPIRLMGTGEAYEVKNVGIFTPKPEERERLGTGSAGYVIANIKTTSEVKIGETITSSKHPAKHPLPGFQEVHPMVFSGIYPLNTTDYERLKMSLSKLQLNDSSFVFQSESSIALGFGYRCGFLGLLHMEIIQERLRREFDLDIISTYPSVIYRVVRSNGTVLEIDNPAFMPDPSVIDHIEEPYVRVFLMCPNDSMGDLMGLVMERRGLCKRTESIDSHRVMLTCEMPLNEILVDFSDKIKTLTRGYGSMDYEHMGHREGALVKLDSLVNHEPVDAFSSICHREKAEYRGRKLAEKLKNVIPQQLFTIAIQAAIGGKIIARETVKSMGKNVTAKCYGGDISRKRKLWEKQKEGKKRMKQIGKVNIPQSAFIAVLKND